MHPAASRGLGAVLSAQFLSALADNALLFAAIALLKANGAPGWYTPLLQEFFLVAYIVLAPFVGHFADAWPKGRVMLAANALKLAGAGAMLAGANPLLAYGLVGVGAATYSPAKYGILSELVTKDKLVKANGLLEGSTIAAILLGVVLGGYLADQGAQLAVSFTVGMYFLAALANLRIPALAPASTGRLRSPAELVREFWSAVRTLMKNPDGRFTLLGTSVFWGTGSTLRFLLVAWVPVALGIMDTSTPANLSGAVAIGIALGAAAAARFVTLDRVNRALPAGIALGVLIMAFAHVTSLPLAIGLLVVVGVCGGFYVVPLNALLQEKGHETVGAGSAIAVQNFFENLLMLVMVGAYTAMTRTGTPPVGMAMTFGGVVLAGIIALAFGRVRKSCVPTSC
ncbi:lysophospholipid transporter LplT [Burkholderia ubonensis]|uniref:lysophospholipid transporter LplT n=1 Tax=Burkholderia ubonensis TaxID=101571 RepID=UPI000752713F|nr:lysophospholipid transporter LplT [Burkholderia ubonensis]KVP39919.1 lysophospholipid transporter LplT [Burkholderia ubonensis]